MNFSSDGGAFIDLVKDSASSLSTNFFRNAGIYICFGIYFCIGLKLAVVLQGLAFAL